MTRNSSNKRRKEFWTIYLPLIITAAFSTISLVRSCNQDRRIGEIQYWQTALGHQPKLEIAGRPQIIGSFKDVPTVGLDTEAFLRANAAGKTPYMDVTCKILLIYKLNITNVGNALAKTVGILTSDTTSARDVIRENILHARFDSMDIRTLDEYFNAELPAGSSDTTRVQFEHVVQFISDNEFTIHIMLLYKNELDQYFDTYYLFHYKFADVYAQYVYDRGRIGILRPPPLEAVQLDSVCTHYNYDEHEKGKLLKRIKSPENRVPIEHEMN